MSCEATQHHMFQADDWISEVFFVLIHSKWNYLLIKVNSKLSFSYHHRGDTDLTK